MQYFDEKTELRAGKDIEDVPLFSRENKGGLNNARG
jgi:hypothetical protein